MRSLTSRASVVVAMAIAGCSTSVSAQGDLIFSDDFESSDTSAWSFVEDGIWHPAPGTSWQWQLTGTIDTSIDVENYDIDLFDTPQATIDTLKAASRAVVCYFSAGSPSR